VVLVGLEDVVAQFVLLRCIDDRPQQRETATLAVHAVLPRRKRDATHAVPMLPERKADGVQSV
jgi:hypothetical protein